MKLRKYLSLILLFTVSLIYAEYNPYFSFFKAKFPTDSDYENLKSLAGDTIFFEVPDYISTLSNVKKVVPDTIFKKNKRPKKPKEGKHYTLQYNYKGQLEGDAYVTPAAEVKDKPFKLLAVDKIMVPGSPADIMGYSLMLQDPETGERIYYEIEDKSVNNVKLYSKRINSEINKLKNDTVYIKTGPEDIDYTPYHLQEATVWLALEAGMGKVNASPHSIFVLESPGRTPVRLFYNPMKNNTEESLISYSEYQTALKKHKEALEAVRVYEIDYNPHNDSTAMQLAGRLPEKYIMGKTTADTYVSQTIRPGNSPLGYRTIPENTIIFVADELHVPGTDYYKAALDGKPFFIKKEDVEIQKPEVLKQFLSQPKEVRDVLLGFAVYNSLVFREYLLEEHYKELKKYTDRGLVILAADVFDESDFTDGTGVKFCIWNTSQKTIKYFTFNYVGYNAVDDPVPNMWGTTLTLKGIGPIESGDNGCYEDNYVWWTDIVQYCELKSVVVEYTNKTKRTYKGKELEELPEGLLEALDYDSPVEDFLPQYDND